MPTASELMGQDTDTDDVPDLSITETPEPADHNSDTVRGTSEEETPEPAKARVGKDGRVRDDKGKYTRVVDDIDGPGDLEKEPEFTTEGAKAEEVAPTPETAPAPEAPKDEPWSFYGRGKTVEIPGAVYRKGVGVFIPEKAGDVDVLGDIRARLVRAESLPEIQARSEQYRKQVESGYTQHALENAAMTKAFGAFLKPEGFNQLIADINKFGADVVFEKLGIALQREQIDIQNQLRESGAQMVGAPDDGKGGVKQEVVTQAYQTLEDVFEAEIRQQWPGITPEQKALVEKLVVDAAPAMFERASTDDPHGFWAKGGIAVKRSLLVNTIRGAMNGSKPAAPAPTAVASSARPAVPPKPVQAPPSGAGAVKNLAGTGTPTKPRPNGSFANKADFEKWRKSNAID